MQKREFQRRLALVLMKYILLLEDVKREHGDKNVLIVCHGGVMRLIRSYFEDMTNDEYYHYSEPNASVREFEL